MFICILKKMFYSASQRLKSDMYFCETQLDISICKYGTGWLCDSGAKPRGGAVGDRPPLVLIWKNKINGKNT